MTLNQTRVRSSDGLNALEAIAAGRLRLELLDRSRIQEICALEQRCYPYPWSERLIEGEFGKDVSVRLGLCLGTQVAKGAFSAGRATAAANGPAAGSGSLVGFSLSHLIEDELHLLNLAIGPEYQRLGLGRTLLAALLGYSYRRGVRIVFLEVRPSNHAAIALYSALGFYQTGIRRNYYRSNGEDALLFERVVRAEDVSDFQRLSTFLQTPATDSLI